MWQRREDICYESYGTSTATHLKSWWEEGRTDPMHISSVDLDANVAIVHLEEVECALSGADVALAWERGHSDGVSLLEQGHVVAQGSIHIALRGKKRCTECWRSHHNFLKALLEYCPIHFFSCSPCTKKNLYCKTNKKSRQTKTLF